MTIARLAARGLVYYWRTNLAVVAGVATAVAVLSGALLVGDSVRGSLRDLVLERIGRTSHVLISTGYFREDLAAEIALHSRFGEAFTGAVPMIVTEGSVTMQAGDGRAGNVQVYGVDDRFWAFHGLPVESPAEREALLSPALAETLAAGAGDTLLVRVQRPTDVPIETVYGRKDDVGRSVRVAVRETLQPESLGEFALNPRQGKISAIFVPLSRLQADLETVGRVNAVLVSGGASRLEATPLLEEIVRDEATLDDMGLSVRQLGNGLVALEADDGLLDDGVVRSAGGGSAYLTYLANSIRTGDRSIPYSLVTGVDFGPLGYSSVEQESPPPVLLNEWAAEDLDARAGDEVSLEFYLWEEPGRLLTRSAQFRVAGVFGMEDADADLAPDYPGISGSLSLGDWDPPFPIDLDRIRPQDEDYWDTYRTTPKAFIPLATAQSLWGSRYGSLTSIRFAEDRDTVVASLVARLDPFAAGMTLVDVRASGLRSSTGAVDFGEYFVYFSFFIVVAALLLAALFFKLSVEQRVKELGLLGAVGFRPREVAGLFLREGFLLALAGTLIGVAGGIVYAGGIVRALGTWWVGAVGTEDLELHLSAVSIVAGAAGGIIASIGCIVYTLRALSRIPERQLLAGQIPSQAWSSKPRRGLVRAAAVLVGGGAALITFSALDVVPPAGGFFGAGALFLSGALCFYTWWFGQTRGAPITNARSWAIERLGTRSVRYRPSRSALAIGMIAAATFILISVDAFRKDGPAPTGPDSGTGGYAVVVESLLPLVADFDSAEAVDFLGLGDFPDIDITPFRLRPGDDASCLNLYTPENPRIIAPTNAFIAEGRFAFADSLAATAEEEANPWTLLARTEPDGAIPVIGDANSLTYVLHKSLGDDILITEGGREVHLRVVAALSDSIFQGELIISEANFRDAFPTREGYSYLLVSSNDQTTPTVDAMEDAIEFALEDYGADAIGTAERLAAFHQVENTYLSTFQALGGLGLLLGTMGLGAVLLRNVLERRKELALMRSLGFRNPQFFAMVLAENATLLVAGLVTGAVSAGVAIAPALTEQGGRLPSGFLLLMLGGVLAAGLITSLLATVAALGSPMLAALRSE